MTINIGDWTVIQCSRRQDMYSAHVLAKIVEEYRKTGTVPDRIESVWF